MIKKPSYQFINLNEKERSKGNKASSPNSDKRTLVKNGLMGTATLAVYSQLSQTVWIKPVVQSVLIPAHAYTSATACIGVPLIGPPDGIPVFFLISETGDSCVILSFEERENANFLIKANENPLGLIADSDPDVWRVCDANGDEIGDAIIQETSFSLLLKSVSGPDTAFRITVMANARSDGAVVLDQVLIKAI